jgi:LmbE family N-acetylglucosaminyl deacetylase
MRVIVVAMTDGRTSGAIKVINAHLARMAQPALTQAELGAARIAEMRKATVALGVAPSDLVLAHLDAPKSDCGALVTVGEAHDVMAMMAARYPGAVQVTMSYAAERNLDHLACGQALRELTGSGTAGHSEWTISRLWWTLPGPPAHWVLPADALQRNEIYAAIAAYNLWDPEHLSYAIGANSVGAQFRAEQIDPRARVH